MLENLADAKIIDGVVYVPANETAKGILDVAGDKGLAPNVSETLIAVAHSLMILAKLIEIDDKGKPTSI